MYIKTDNKEVGAKLAAYYQAGKPIEIMGKLFLGNSIGFEYPESCVEFHGSEVSKVAWTGEGLPPVGCEFERRFVDQESSSWAYGKVIAHGKRRVFYVDRTGDEWSHSPEDMEFRPIRTPEQIAEEEREKAIKEMIGFIGGSRRREAEYLYDAGYRKQDNADERK